MNFKTTMTLYERVIREEKTQTVKCHHNNNKNKLESNKVMMNYIEQQQRGFNNNKVT